MLRCHHPLLFLRLTFHLPVFWILLVLLVFNLTKHNRYKNGNTDRKNTTYFPKTNIYVTLLCS